MSNVAALARDWLAAKAAEQTIINRRIDIEKQLVAALDVKSEGSVSHNVPGYRITLTQPVYRKVDEVMWRKVAHNCNPERFPIKFRLEADSLGVRWLATHEPNVWRKIAPAFTSTPGKVGVKVEEMKE